MINSKKLLLPVLLSIPLLIGIGWRSPIDGHREAMLEYNDSLYHLYRIETCMENYPRVHSFDPLLHYPEGFLCHWAAFHTTFYATIAKSFGLSTYDRTAIVAHLSWVPPLLGLISIALVMMICFRMTSSLFWAFGGGILESISSFALAGTRYGHLDHHVFSRLGLQLVLLAILKRHFWLWLGGFLLMFLMTPEATLFGTIILALFTIFSAFNKGEQPDSKWHHAPGIAAAIAWCTGRLLDTHHHAPWSLEWTHFDWFHVVWLVFAGWASHSLLGLIHAAKTGQWRRRHTITVSIVFSAGLTILSLLIVFGGGPQFFWQQLMGGGLLPVGERASPLSRTLTLDLWVYLAALPALIHLMKIHKTDRVAYGLLIFAVLWGFKEFRHLQVMAPLLSINVILATHHLLSLAESRTRGVRPILMSVMMLALVSGLILTRWPGRFFGTVVLQDRLASIRTITDWLSVNTPPVHPMEPEYGVLSGWTIGHHIAVLARRPAVLDPFNHVGIVEPMRAFYTAGDAQSLKDSLTAYGVRYWVLFDPHTFITSSYPGGRARFETHIEGVGSCFLEEELMASAAFRLYVTQEPVFDFLKLRYSSERLSTLPMANREGESRVLTVPFIQIYEFQP